MSLSSINTAPLQTAVGSYRSALRVCDLVISKKKKIEEESLDS